MASRRHNPRRAKSHLSYSIIDAADLYGVHRRTVRNWLAEGLEPNEGGRPILIHGTSLNRFLDHRRKAGRTVCGPGEMYCLGCKRPSRPAGNMADFIPKAGSGGTVKGICAVCDGMMSQHVNSTRLAIFRAELEIATRPRREPIEGS